MRKFIIEGLLGRALTEPAPGADTLAELGATLSDRTRARLGRSLAIRHVDAGSCNGCELELQALSNPLYDLERFGLHFVASPRHAAVLTVTGPVPRNMAQALRRAHAATPPREGGRATGHGRSCTSACGWAPAGRVRGSLHCSAASTRRASPSASASFAIETAKS